MLGKLLYDLMKSEGGSRKLDSQRTWRVRVREFEKFGFPTTLGEVNL